jgi:hypothetical protein
MRSLYLLWHTFELRDGVKDAKLVGVYPSRHLAEKEIEEKYWTHAGCNVEDDFVIDVFEVGEEGFNAS